MLNDLGTRRKTRDTEVQDPTAITADDEETAENAEGDRWNREEVHCCNRFAMISQEGTPTLSGFGGSWSATHPSGHSSLGSVEPEHQELSVDAGCAPGRILRRHPENQIATFLGDPLPPDGSAYSGDRFPVKSKSSPMPPNHGLGADENESLLRTRPKPARENPEQLIEQF
jgi:hypothetical protein